jgi:hypothetical protein
MADEGRVEGRGSNIKAGVPIEKAKANKVSPEKTPEGPEGGLKLMKFVSLAYLEKNKAHPLHIF